MVSDVWLPVELVPLLVEPVVSRDSDITLTQHADSVSADRLSDDTRHNFLWHFSVTV